MCGLLGVFSKNPENDFAKRLDSALHTLDHRGPDDRGLLSYAVERGQLALGHTRLSIIDLSQGGHQPMSCPEGRYYIVFNGEIYNYRELRQELSGFGHYFKTDSDTEVLLAAWVKWGESCLRRLAGMFSFAIFDRHDTTLTLVRDAFGIKPLFYRLDNNGFCFASEIPSLLALLPVRPGLNYKSAYDYLVWGRYDTSRETFYQDIEQLEPGHVLQVDLQKLAVGQSACIRRRWWWPSICERTDLSFQEAAAQLREKFLKSVSLHLRSDVPVGAALSGGIDSSAVVCAIRHLEPQRPIHTFTFIAPGTLVDEERWADIVNSHVGAISNKVFVQPHELVRDLDDMIQCHGEPFGSTSIYAQYRVFQAVRNQGITVTLDGQGADEMLAGYDGYPQSYVRSLLDRHRYSELYSFLKAWIKWPGRSRRRVLMTMAGAMTPRQWTTLSRRFVGQDPAPAWLNRHFLSNQMVELRFPELPEPSTEGRGRRLAEQLRWALTGQGLAPLLRHGDRDSMRWSIESRVPFLTTDLAEFLLQLPESYLVSPDGETKFIFREAMRDIVPNQILDRRDKVGFETPELDWLRDQGSRIQEWLGESDLLPFLNGPACRAEVSSILDGKKPFGPQMWRLINYCRWIQLAG